MAVRQTGIGKCITWVLFDCLLEVFRTLPHLVGSSSIPMVAASQIKSIGFGVLRGTLREVAFIRTAQFQAQVLRDSPGDFLFELKNIVELAMIALAPKMKTRGDIHQFRAHYQIV